VSTPQKLGPFELGREIGQGSYGVVYEALDPVRHLRTAVKHFVHAPPGAKVALARVRRDARAAGALGHPNIGAVVAVGEEGETSWVATELVSGVSLAQIVRSTAQWPIERVLDVWRQLCEGLAHAHREGLLHLDLKPSDIRVNTSGDVKVLDFGSWHLKSIEGQRRIFVDSGLRYRPPEVVSGHRPDSRADIFAVAAIVYEVVARRRAFPGESTTDVIRSVTRCEPDLATLPSSAFSPGFERLLAASLAGDPSRRSSSFEEVHADLVQLVRDTAPRLREAAPTSTGARPERDVLLAELTRARAEDRLEDALETCRRLRALDPEDETARRAFAEVESVLQSREADALVGEALALAADGHLDEATAIAEKVERLAPWSPRYLQLQVYLDEEGARRQAESHLDAARAHLVEGRREEAHAAILEALTAMPGYRPALDLRSQLGPVDYEGATDDEAAGPAPAAVDPAPLTPSGVTLESPDASAASASPADPPGVKASAPEPAASDASPPVAAASPTVGPGGRPRAVEDPGPAPEATSDAEPASARPAAESGAKTEAAGDLPTVEVEEPETGATARERPAEARVAASRRVEAEALTASALRHFLANEHDQARKVVDRALDLDPVNRRARELQRILRVLG